MVLPFFFEKIIKGKRKAASRPKSQASVSCLSYRHGAPTQWKPRGICLLNAFCWEILHENVYKDCLPPGRMVLSPDEQTVPVLRTEHSPPYVGELPCLCKRLCALGKDSPSLPLWSTPQVHPNYAPAHMKAEPWDEKSSPVTSPVEMLFWIHVQPADQLSTKKVLLQLGKYALNSHCSIQRRWKMNGSVAQDPKAKMRFLDKKLRAQFPFG